MSYRTLVASPQHIPVGTPTQWYSPTHTPVHTPVGSFVVTASGAEHRRSVDSFCSAVSDILGTQPAQLNSCPADTGPAESGKEDELNHSSGSVNKDDSAPDPSTEGALRCCASLTSREILTLVALCFTNICSSMFASLLAPFFPTEAVKKGATETDVGLIFGSFQLVSFIMSPIWGSYISRIGAKFMFVSGVCVCGSCAILFGILQWCPPGGVFIAMCFLCRSLEAAASAAVSTANMAIAAYTFPSLVTTVIGLLSACSCIGLMLGPPIGGMLFQLGGFHLPFLLTGSGFVLAGLLCMCFLPSPTESLEASGAEVKVSKWTLLKVPVISVVGYVVFMAQFAIGYMDVVFTIHLSSSFPYLSPEQIGAIFLIAPFVVVLLAPSLGHVADKFPAAVRPVIIVGVFVSALGFAGLGPSHIYDFMHLPHSLCVVLVSLAVSGVGWGALVVTYKEFNNAARRIGFLNSIESQGLVAGIYNAFSNLGALLGPVLAGVLDDMMGFVESSTLVAVLIALAGVVLVVYTILEHFFCPLPPPDIPSEEHGVHTGVHGAYAGGADGYAGVQNAYTSVHDSYREPLLGGETVSQAHDLPAKSEGYTNAGLETAVTTPPEREGTAKVPTNGGSTGFLYENEGQAAMENQPGKRNPDTADNPTVPALPGPAFSIQEPAAQIQSTHELDTSAHGLDKSTQELDKSAHGLVKSANEPLKSTQGLVKRGNASDSSDKPEMSTFEPTYAPNNSTNKPHFITHAPNKSPYEANNSVYESANSTCSSQNDSNTNCNSSSKDVFFDV